MEDSRRGMDPEKDWKEWFGPEGQVEKQAVGPTATIPADEEEELHGDPDNRGVIDKIWDAIRGDEAMDYADQNQGKSV